MLNETKQEVIYFNQGLDDLLNELNNEEEKLTETLNNYKILKNEYE